MFSRFLHSAKGLGCYRDTGRRAIATMEGRSRLLKGHYRRRRDAIRKCALAAYKRGYRVFAVQHGGWCAASRTGHRTYGRYGRSNRCRNGKGGPWANDVYVLKGKKGVLSNFMYPTVFMFIRFFVHTFKCMVGNSDSDPPRFFLVSS